MARVTHVKRAQQRYATVPVIDPATGEPKRTPVMRNGVQRTTKRGKPITMTVTQRDLTRPLPLLTCESCGKPIEIGTPYKHVTPKSGPYGGRQRNRHEGCPNWKPWDLSNAWWARIAQATDGFDVSGAESADDVTSALEEVAQAIRDLSEESREAASNIEEGFGHPTYQSEEAEQRADDLEAWADEIESVDVPDLEDYECGNCTDGTAECPTCDGEGTVGEGDECPDCSGSGEEDCTECDGEGHDLETWRAEVEDAVSIVNESPV